MDTESLKSDLLAKLTPAYTAPWAEQFLRDLCRLAEVHGPELKELIDSIQLCVCGHPSEEMKAAMAKAVFDNDYADLERLRAQPTPPKPSGFRKELAEEREHRARMEQRLKKLEDENQAQRERTEKE